VRFVPLLSLLVWGCSALQGPPVQISHTEHVTPTGVQYIDKMTGVGRLARITDRVTVHYTARVAGGKKVDSSHDRGEPETFLLSAAPMRRRGKRWILVPPHRAFGDEGVEGLIPPGATLEFLVELIEIERATQ
jgi:FKBP-type peptidyl-prolyl cis-trans isomerase